jgi:hypothetical protein
MKSIRDHDGAFWDGDTRAVKRDFHVPFLFEFRVKKQALQHEVRIAEFECSSVVTAFPGFELSLLSVA